MPPVVRRVTETSPARIAVKYWPVIGAVVACSVAWGAHGVRLTRIEADAEKAASESARVRDRVGDMEGDVKAIRAIVERLEKR